MGVVTLSSRVDVTVVEIAAVNPHWASSLLTQSEFERMTRYRFTADRQRFAAARASLRVTLSALLPPSETPLDIELDGDDRPFAASLRDRGLDFNVSHTTDLAVIAVSTGRVGVDVERFDRRVAFDEVMDGWFTPAERACVRAGCAGAVGASFFRHWTAKEAYLKALGCGVRKLRDVEMRCADRGAVRWKGSRDDARQLHLRMPTPEHWLAVVADAPSDVTFCRFDPTTASI